MSDGTTEISIKLNQYLFDVVQDCYNMGISDPYQYFEKIGFDKLNDCMNQGHSSKYIAESIKKKFL